MADRDNQPWREGTEEEAEEEIDETDYKSQKDALLFAIEISDSMMELPPPSDSKKADSDSFLSAALKCAYQVMQHRIISSPKDLMGIILFGTAESKFIDVDGKSTASYPNCYVYQTLDVPGAEDVKALKDLVEDGVGREEILTPAKGKKPPLADVLFCVNQLFAVRAPNFSSRRLFIITDNDDPYPGDKGFRNTAATRAKDLYDNGAFIELFPVARGNDTFDLTKFYDDIIYRDSTAELTHNQNLSRSADGLPLLESLISNINSKQTPKRAYFSNMPLELSPGLVISVKGYNVIHKQKPAPTCQVWLDGETPQLAHGETNRLAQDSARTVEKEELKKAYKVGNEYIYFTPEELSNVKKWGDKVIRIIGFKDRALLHPWMSLDKSIFIYPSEDLFVGSTRVFSALWQKLIKSKKIGISWHVPRANSHPRLVALIPSGGQSGEKSGTSSMPAGIWLYPIPTADDVRQGFEPTYIRAPSKLVDCMNMVVRQLQLPNAEFNPLKYPNPSLQWHYRILQALALEEEIPDKPEDATMPKYKAIHKRSGGYMQEWAAVADEALGQWEERQTIKREIEADNDEGRPPAAKRARTSKSSSVEPSVMDVAALKKMVNSGAGLSKLKVADLKAILTARGLDTKGAKAALVERLEGWLENN